MTAASNKGQGKRVPIGLARARKEHPPPGKIFKSKKTESHKRAKEKLQRELSSFWARKFS